MVCAAPWVYGAVHPGFEFLLFAGVGLILALWAARMLVEGQVDMILGGAQRLARMGPAPTARGLFGDRAEAIQSVAMVRMALWEPSRQGLLALRVRPNDMGQWNGPYMQVEIPKDPWGHDYFYRFPGEHGEEPEVVSFGADGQPGGDGLNADIVSWKSQ